MNLQAMSRVKAREIIAAEMCCDLDGEALRISVISECLRAMSTLCSAPLAEYRAWEPAVSIRLTGMVRHRLTPLWPNLDAEEKDGYPTVMDLLDDLHELGDMVKLDGGKWLPAPPHLIRVGDGKAILLGGGAINMFPLEVAESIRIVGRVRFAEQKICEDWAEVWEIDEWIGDSGEGLELWSECFLAKIITKLVSAPEHIGEVLVYQRHKWISLQEISNDKKVLYLCKVPVGQGASYFVGEFSRGKLQRMNSIHSDDARRLRFHLDAQSGQSVRVKAVLSQSLIKLKLKRFLPKKEARVLLLGWQTPSSKEQQKYGVEYIFPREVLPILRRAFERLKIEMEEFFEQDNN